MLSLICWIETQHAMRKLFCFFLLSCAMFQLKFRTDKNLGVKRERKTKWVMKWCFVQITRLPCVSYDILECEKITREWHYYSLIGLMKDVFAFGWYDCQIYPISLDKLIVSLLGEFGTLRCNSLTIDSDCVSIINVWEEKNSLIRENYLKK